ncbi:DUF4760 domain-containing protein [Amycolatopsis magusensis]|uniref:DUF4760 domain-containing protein n=1 Tax=Amycolatopsis magusensis TaxID=882444 RepID=UPI003788FFC0
MDVPLAISILSTIIALSAVLAGSVLARKQAKAAKSQVIAHFSGIIAEAGQSGFAKKIDYVRHEFHTEFEREVPIGELPPTARAAVSDVVNYFDRIGLLVASDALDAKIVIGYMGNWIDQTWTTLFPNIHGERLRRQRLATEPNPISTGYLVYFEHLVWLVRHTPPAKIHRKLKLRRLTDLTPSAPDSGSGHPLGVVRPSENA